MLILIESLAMCFILLIICVVGIANGPVGSVYFYEPEMQERVVELGLTTKEKIKKGYTIAAVCLFVPILFFVPAMVYCINGARGFLDIFVANALFGEKTTREAALLAPTGEMAKKFRIIPYDTLNGEGVLPALMVDAAKIGKLKKEKVLVCINKTNFSDDFEGIVSPQFFDEGDL